MNLAFMTLWEAGYGSPLASKFKAEEARLVDGKCSRCGRLLKKRGAHFHLRACLVTAETPA